MNRLRTFLASFALLLGLCFASAAAAQCSGTLTVKDSTGTTQTLAQQTTSGVEYPCQASGLVPPGATRIRGSTSTTSTTPATPIFAAGGAGIYNYVLAVECWNTSATNVTVTLTDTASTQLIVPQTFGNTLNFPISVPLITAANTALNYTSSSGVTTTGCAAQGYTWNVNQ